MKTHEEPRAEIIGADDGVTGDIRIHDHAMIAPFSDAETDEAFGFYDRVCYSGI